MNRPMIEKSLEDYTLDELARYIVSLGLKCATLQIRIQELEQELASSVPQQPIRAAVKALGQ